MKLVVIHPKGTIDQIGLTPLEARNWVQDAAQASDGDFLTLIDSPSKSEIHIQKRHIISISEVLERSDKS